MKIPAARLPPQNTGRPLLELSGPSLLDLGGIVSLVLLETANQLMDDAAPFFRRELQRFG